MRVCVFVDGFNLYHALLALGDKSLKWVDLRALISCYLDGGDILEQVYYFSALLESNVEKKAKHLEYIHALETKGVTAILGKFKKKSLKCKACNALYTAYEEKQSDVNIAIQMLEDAFLDRCDKMILVSADTDFVSTVKKIRRLFPEKKMILLAPPKRLNRCYELRAAVHASLEIKKAHIKKSLFNPIYVLLVQSTETQIFKNA
ncbi:hypothetical protein NHP200010_04320 [Helicobacter bizzozeronii]|uniref:NYN domain-containing protein n=1 Tax=Helicobacter bizzozeronii TaxID=56877 RepID=UPI00244D7E80|nr:NYN domain-containing protein [Helicobacter bizzozeronii]GMB92721.1 hypothetical protein NHP200010_04320 [Helicobacter bizzozeronii]